MAKICISEPDGPYRCELDTGAMRVEIRETFLGVGLTSADGERLSVSMRDTGFEICYAGRWYELKGGSVVGARAGPRGHRLDGRAVVQDFVRSTQDYVARALADAASRPKRETR
jgi:hypothetical protein